MYEDGFGCLHNLCTQNKHPSTYLTQNAPLKNNGPTSMKNRGFFGLISVFEWVISGLLVGC